MNRTCTLVIDNSPQKELAKARKGEPMIGRMELVFAGHTLLAKWALSRKGQKILGRAESCYAKMWHDNPKDETDYSVKFTAYAGTGEHLKNTGEFLDLCEDLRKFSQDPEEVAKDLEYVKNGK